jgi:hypothetical protein
LNKYLITLGFDDRKDQVKETALVFKIWDIKHIANYFDYSETAPTGGEIFNYTENHKSPI